MLPLRIAVMLAMLLPAISTHAGEDDSTHIVRQLLTAYNDHDVAAMLELFTEDVRWMSVAGPVISVEATGPDEIASAMHSFFQNRPSTQSELHSVSSAGPFVTALEEAYRIVDGKRRGQCANSVYEVRDKKLKTSGTLMLLTALNTLTLNRRLVVTNNRESMSPLSQRSLRSFKRPAGRVS